MASQIQNKMHTHTHIIKIFKSYTKEYKKKKKLEGFTKIEKGSLISYSRKWTLRTLFEFFFSYRTENVIFIKFVLVWKKKITAVWVKYIFLWHKAEITKKKLSWLHDIKKRKKSKNDACSCYLIKKKKVSTFFCLHRIKVAYYRKIPNI